MRHRAIAAWIASTVLATLRLSWPACCVAAPSDLSFTNATVLSIINTVEVRRFGSESWDAASVESPYHLLKPGDRLRTGKNSRALLRLSNLTDFPVGELTQLEIPREQRRGAVVRLLQGIMYFFHRDRPGEFQVDTPTISAVVRGTEFVVEVAESQETRVQVLDGELEITNLLGGLTLRSGEAGVATPLAPPRKTAVISSHTADVAQWCLYYPGILNLDELTLTTPTTSSLGESLAAYRAGDLPGALRAYPEGRTPQSQAERVYRAALLLSAGSVDTAERLLGATVDGSDLTGLAASLRKVVAAVKYERANRESAVFINTNSATAWLAESYWRQSQFELPAALAAASRATELAPEFAFAWEQLAELQFGFGRMREAAAALDRSLVLAPRNAQALALRGFLLAAQNRDTEAIRSFDSAILADGTLANGWLGRGLCRIRCNNLVAGRADLLVAATLEPQRGVLRSYLAKALADSGDAARALNELALAQKLDPGDPTSWLYGALIRQRLNSVNDAVRDLERSTELNQNRRTYRSRLLLDQDRAVRGANLARLYELAGMSDVSLREAVRAVNADYADYSAHVFLGNTYNSLRDPRGYELRFETPWLSEYLVANLLAPAAAGALTSPVTQQEYSRLFERHKPGLASATEYRSGGDWSQDAVQYGIFNGWSYTLEEAYRSDNGFRPNNDREALALTTKLKLEITAQDSLFFQSTVSDFESGDLAQYFDPIQAQTGLRVRESQEPLLLAGWHHEWNPSAHTLVLGGYWRDAQEVADSAAPILYLRRNAANQIVGIPATTNWPVASATYRNVFEAGTAEVQHIHRFGSHTAVAGTRFQGGTFATDSSQGRSTSVGFYQGTNKVGANFSAPGLTNSVHNEFCRISCYAYDTWRLFEPLSLTLGASYDWLQFPANFRNPPLADHERTMDRLNPKAGVIWTPTKTTVIRAAYTRSLGGVSFDQSFRLEPSQVGGFNQAFRDLIPESVAGSLAAACFETRSLSLEQKFGTGTYLGMQVERLGETANQQVGEISLMSSLPVAYAFTNSQHKRFDFEEENVSVTLNQLLGRHWGLGARYRWSEADLGLDWTDLPANVFPGAQNDMKASLHQITLSALFNHESGYFGYAEGLWLHQSSRGYEPPLSDADFWQFNVFFGYHFCRRQAEVKIGIFNLTDRDYRLNPLNLLTELPRTRTFVAAFRFFF